jgi:hypothetical protein
VQGPTLSLAVSTAARIGSALPADVLRALLRHSDPAIGASACGCARRRPELISAMIDLLDDVNQGVARSAACALGQIGRIEARPMLAKLLREYPSEEVIEPVPRDLIGKLLLPDEAQKFRLIAPSHVKGLPEVIELTPASVNG